MLILKEENSHLKGTKHTLPKKIVDLYHNIILKYPQYSANGGYRTADNVLSNQGVVTMEWLKGMKSFFNKHVDTNDIDFVLGGGIVVKTFVENKLDQLTSSTPKTRKQHTNNPVKPLTPADNLSGHRGEKSSQALSMVNSLMSDITPKLNSSVEKQMDEKTILIKESQLKYILENLTQSLKYIGNCVDVAYGRNKICKIFPDATTMAKYVGNPDEDNWGDGEEITKDEFLSLIDIKQIPKQALVGESRYFYIDPYGDLTLNTAKYFFMYNIEQDIHYFFEK